MSESTSIAFAGCLLGLASSLHCAAMCGGLSTALLKLVHGDSGRGSMAWPPLEPLLVMQAGRISAYVLLGAAAGMTGSAFAGLTLSPSLSAAVLKWAAAASLMWIGLSMAGLVPELSLPAALASRASRAMTVMTRPMRRHTVLGPYAAGFSWAICPCPLVHGALFLALFTGSGLEGALVMAAFGLGTVPAVIASTLGLRLLMLSRRYSVRVSLGLALFALGSVLLYLDQAGGPLCLTS